MKKRSVKLTAIVVSVIMCMTVIVPALFAFAGIDKTLKFDSDGKFTILQISDIQDGADLMSITSDFIKDTVDRVQPDLVVLTGDNIAGYRATTKYLATAAIDAFMKIFEKRGVPVAMVYGNHDDQTTSASKEYQMSKYEKYSCFVGCEGENLTGCGNYNLPILSSDGSRTAFNLWMIDSLAYNDENDLGGYGCPHADQINWYV